MAKPTNQKSTRQTKAIMDALKEDGTYKNPSDEGKSTDELKREAMKVDKAKMAELKAQKAAAVKDSKIITKNGK